LPTNSLSSAAISLGYAPAKALNQLAVAKWQGKIFSWVYLIAIFSFPVSSYIAEFAGIQSNILSIAARGITLLATLYYAGFMVYHGLFRPIRLVFIFLLFWVLYIVRIVYDTTNTPYLLGRPAIDYYLFGILISFLCTIPYFVPVRYNTRQLYFRIWMLLLVLSTVGLYNNLTSDTLFFMRSGGNERLNPITFGLHAALLGALSLFYFTQSVQKTLWRMVALGGLAISITNIALSASKSPTLFLCISILIFCYYQFLRRRIFAVLMVIGVLIAGVAYVLGSSSAEAFMLVLDRFVNIDSDLSSLERIEMLQNAIDQFTQHPFWGSFLEERIFKEYPHNLVVESFMALGLVGGIVFVSYYLWAWFSMIRYVRSGQLDAVGFICLSMLVVTVFSGGLAFATDFWISTAVISCLARNTRYSDPLAG
jgi:O-antigen ligase